MNLDALRQKLITMAKSCDDAVRDSIQALLQRDLELALKVKASDNTIDNLELEIDALAIRLLTQAPLATDLRLIRAAMKISQNLERIGDEATKISKQAAALTKEPALDLNLELPRMEDMALAMLSEAMEAFVQNDSARARNVIPLDAVVDDLNRKNQKIIAHYMVENPQLIPLCLKLMVVAKSLEKVADHAESIAEEVVYLCEGIDIRHPLLD